MREISQLHSTLSSYAFFSKPVFRLLKVTFGTGKLKKKKKTHQNKTKKFICLMKKKERKKEGKAHHAIPVIGDAHNGNLPAAHVFVKCLKRVKERLKEGKWERPSRGRKRRRSCGLSSFVCSKNSPNYTAKCNLFDLPWVLVFFT